MLPRLAVDVVTAAITWLEIHHLIAVASKVVSKPADKIDLDQCLIWINAPGLIVLFRMLILLESRDFPYRQ
jgi:hypothetical protein